MKTVAGCLELLAVEKHSNCFLFSNSFKPSSACSCVGPWRIHYFAHKKAEKVIYSLLVLFIAEPSYLRSLFFLGRLLWRSNGITSSRFLRHRIVVAGGDRYFLA